MSSPVRLLFAQSFGRVDARSACFGIWPNNLSRAAIRVHHDYRLGPRSFIQRFHFCTCADPLIVLARIGPIFGRHPFIHNRRSRQVLMLPSENETQNCGDGDYRNDKRNEDRVRLITVLRGGQAGISRSPRSVGSSKGDRVRAWVRAQWPYHWSERR
jgi:hypothetical protein